MSQWIDACALDDIDEEDAITFKYEEHYYALYRTDDDRYFVTDGLCTHEGIPIDWSNSRLAASYRCILS